MRWTAATAGFCTLLCGIKNDVVALVLLIFVTSLSLLPGRSEPDSLYGPRFGKHFDCDAKGTVLSGNLEGGRSSDGSARGIFRRLTNGMSPQDLLQTAPV